MKRNYMALALLIAMLLELAFPGEAVRAAPGSANLASVTLEGITLDQGFTPDVTEYTASVSSELQQTRVRAVAEDISATIKINQSAVASGALSGGIALNSPTPSADGTTAIVIDVTAQDGALKTYRFTITRKRPPGVQDASASAISDTAIKLIWSTPNDRTDLSTVMIKKDGIVLGSVPASNKQYMATGLRGDQAYTFELVGYNRLGQQGASVSVPFRSLPAQFDKLIGLGADETGLNQFLKTSFTSSSKTVVYRYSSYTTSSIVFTPTLGDPAARLAINGAEVASGQAAPAVPLTPGQNNIITMTVVTAGGTTGSSYELQIYVPPVPSAALNSLSLEGITLDTAFSPAVTSYTATVPAALTKTKVTVAKQETNAVTAVNGTMFSGAVSHSLTLLPGTTTLTIAVTASNGAKQTYTITLNKASGAKDLVSLSLSAPLQETFVPSRTSYTVIVHHAVSSVTVTAAVDTAATLKVNGMVTASGQAAEVALPQVGVNTIQIGVFAQGGSSKVYTISVTRLPASAQSELSYLSLNGATLQEVFSPGKTLYTATASASIDGIQVTGIASPEAVVRVNGKLAGSGSAVTVPLTAGLNTVSVEVTAQDQTKRQYTITITRLASSLKSELASLSLGDVSLNERFAPSTVAYTANVDYNRSSVSVIAAADASSTIRINGNQVGSGSPYAIYLSPGRNPMRVEVFAADGSSKAYSIVITKAGLAGSLLSVVIFEGIHLNEPFETGRTVYSAFVPNDKTQVNVMSMAVSPAYLTLNNTYLPTGTTTPMPLQVGLNTIQLRFFDGSDTPKQYTVFITRVGQYDEINGNGVLSKPIAANTKVTVQQNELLLKLPDRKSGNMVTPSLAQVRESFEANSAVQTVAVELQEYRGTINSARLEADLLEYVKAKSLAVRFKTPSVSLTVEAAQLPAAPTTFTITRVDPGPLPAYARRLQPDIEIAVEGPAGKLPMEVELHTSLAESEALRSVMYQNGELIQSRTRGKTKVARLAGPGLLSLAVAERRFVDMNNHWAAKEVAFMAEKMLVNGYEDQQFRPDALVTRAEFVTMIVNALGMQDVAVDAVPYADVPRGTWHEHAISAAASLQLVQGNEAGLFQPDELITRQEIAVIFSRVMKRLGMDPGIGPDAAETALAGFADTNSISSWATEGMAASVKAGIISGASNGLLAPQGYGSRAQATVMLYRLLSAASGF